MTVNCFLPLHWHLNGSTRFVSCVRVASATSTRMSVVFKDDATSLVRLTQRTNVWFVSQKSQPQAGPTCVRLPLRLQPLRLSIAIALISAQELVSLITLYVSWLEYMTISYVYVSWLEYITISYDSCDNRIYYYCYYYYYHYHYYYYYYYYHYYYFYYCFYYFFNFIIIIIMIIMIIINIIIVVIIRAI